MLQKGNRNIISGSNLTCNPDHLSIVKQGAATIAEFRRNNPGIIFELCGGDFSGLDMHDSDLSDADMRYTIFHRTILRGTILRNTNMVGSSICNCDASGADFTRSRLSQSELHHVCCRRADFSLTSMDETIIEDCDFSEANFYMSDLSNGLLKSVNLVDANASFLSLNGATLCRVDAQGANLTFAYMGGTFLASCSIRHAIGLHTIRHDAPSFVDVDTLALSFDASEGDASHDIRVFLAGIGIQEEVSKRLETVLNIGYPFCFICYGQPDLDFAEKLERDLRLEGISCWLFSRNSMPGKRIWNEIGVIRHQARSIIVLCSSQGLVRDGLLKEIEDSIDEEPERILTISLDELWKEPGFLVRRGERDLKPFLLDRKYIDFSDKSKYAESFGQLLEAMKSNRDASNHIA